jgi:hypothetical protein
MKTKVFFLFVFCILGSRPLHAQAQVSDPMADWLFPPDFVIQQERAIKLNAEQRAFIQAEIKSMEAHMRTAERLVREGSEKLLALVKRERVNEQEALEQVDSFPFRSIYPSCGRR